ncbi:hypothetical protein SAMN05444336_11530 [Albimonas donghaensis]|uniref:Uncharacterized protein n=1 Tax=Albimonas donghaensis TaxID=356660 RepID=A0A1H3G1T4_9RHOB|nr:hypothetical protein [Albimonas donghaensis]SDX96374.1 hypothetical protein SAMN05444336_11530 [Albimonas donghaensis]
MTGDPRLPHVLLWRLRFAPGRLQGAAARALAVLVCFSAPAVAMSFRGAEGEGADGVVASLVPAAAAALFVLLEYGARTPSMIDFRFAPPVNRLRFALICAVLGTVTLCEATSGPGGPAAPFANLASWLDFRFSPARMAAESLARPAARGPDPSALAAASAALVASAAATLAALGVILSGRWPRDPERFNPWTNMPTFEPATEGEASARLRRLGAQVVVTALALPIALLVVGRAATTMVDADAFLSPLALTWSATIWAATPGMLVVRGAAILRLARLAERAERAGRA